MRITIYIRYGILAHLVFKFYLSPTVAKLCASNATAYVRPLAAMAAEIETN
jgi:hypothetical protein